MKSVWLALMPAVFVFLWSTGFIGAKYGLPYAEPFTFLTLRLALVLAGFAAFAALTATRWPSAAGFGHAMVVGVLVHAGYLGGVFTSIDGGVPAGISAMIVSLQPLLTAVVVGPLLGERLTWRQGAGFVLGVVGVALVLFGDQMSAGGAASAPGVGAPVWAIGASIVALISITTGTLYQKRYCGGIDIRAGAVAQYLAATGVTAALALAFEPLEIAWSGDFLFALAWLVVVLSFGATTLLMLLIRMGAASRTASLFYLVPPMTALIAFIMFDEALGPTSLIGMLVSVCGVALVIGGASQPGKATPGQGVRRQEK
ncbi:DMT family transporter [Fodinicurvata sp. EGI_FJ10296]|uniref:DMT family transporter n=1 Tax=Fodinicurvata sp. EGI_FJ10296 TaxID=3231908 RepID=UPI003456BD98